MIKSSIQCSVFAIVAALTTQVVYAQDNANPVANDGVQEIVVTAQKRSENVQKVPIAISAFSAKALQERAVGNVSQLSGITPNVNLDASTPFSGSTAVLSAFIRGIGSDDFAFNIDPGVGIYVDGVYLARTVGANQDLLDVDRVEILKGPQGTLFGRNTIGGAVQIVTRDPGKTFKFTGDVTTGSYNRMQARGSVDIPITDGLYSSFTFGIESKDGYVHRISYTGAGASLLANEPSYTSFNASGYNSPQTEGSEDKQNFRVKLKFDKGGPLKVTLSGDYTHDTSDAANTLLGTAVGGVTSGSGTTNVFAPPAANETGEGALDHTGVNGFNFAGLYNFCIGATTLQIAARNAQALCGVIGTQYSTKLGALANGTGTPTRLAYGSQFVTGNIDTTYSTGNDFSDLNNWGLGGTIDYKLSPQLALKSITAYRQLDWKSGLDADGSPLNFLQLSFSMHQWQVSQEVQVLGNAFDKKLNYVLGGYYFKEKGDLHDYVTFAEGLLQVDGPNNLDTENYALFGQTDFKPIDLIGITLGGRYTHETKHFEGGQQDLNGLDYKIGGMFGCSDALGNINVGCQGVIGYPNPANPLQVYAPGWNRLAFNNFSPKIGVQLYPNKDMMFYGSWSKGYKTGGWTTRLTNPQPTAQSFNPEYASTFELGVKSSWLNHKLQFNAAAFSTIYDGIQLNYQVGTSPTIGNAGNALIRGLEAEVVARPIPAFTINASIGYIDAHFTYLNTAVLAVSGPNAYQQGASAGGALPKTPEFKINISPRYEFKLDSGAKIVAIADWTHTSSIANDVQRTYLLMRAPMEMVNGSLSFTPSGERFTLTVGGTNLTNHRYLMSGGSNLSDGVAFGTYNRPTEWYARLGVKF